MDKVEDIICAVLRLSLEWSLAMVRRDVGVVELLHVLQPRQAAHHVLATKLMQRVKVDVAIASVPTPRFIVMLHGETNRVSDVEV